MRVKFRVKFCNLFYRNNNVFSSLSVLSCMNSRALWSFLFITFSLLMGIFQTIFHTQHCVSLSQIWKLWKVETRARAREKNSWKKELLKLEKLFHENNVHKSSLYFLPNDDLFTAFLFFLLFIFVLFRT